MGKALSATRGSAPGGLGTRDGLGCNPSGPRAPEHPKRVPRVRKKHINKILTGLSRDYPGTVPGLSRPFPEISWEFCLCVSLSPGEKGETQKQFDPHPFPGQSREVVYVYWFFLPRTDKVSRTLGTLEGGPPSRDLLGHCLALRQPVDPVVADPVRQDNDKIRGNPKYHPFLGITPFLQSTPKTISASKCKLAPSKM